MNCHKCGGKMELSDGWYPTYNNPDNANFDEVAEPYCPTCDQQPADHPMNPTGDDV